MQRWLIGLMAIGLLAAGAILITWSGSGGGEQYAAGCLRAGVLLAVFWLALPDTRPLKNRLVLAAVLVIALLLVARPRMLLFLFSPPVLIVIVTLAVLWRVLRPRGARRSQRRAPPSETLRR